MLADLAKGTYDKKTDKCAHAKGNDKVYHGNNDLNGEFFLLGHKHERKTAAKTADRTAEGAADNGDNGAKIYAVSPNQNEDKGNNCQNVIVPSGTGLELLLIKNSPEIFFKGGDHKANALPSYYSTPVGPCQYQILKRRLVLIISIEPFEKHPFNRPIDGLLTKTLFSGKVAF